VKSAKRILAHPFRHIAVTLPILWRGIFIEMGCLSKLVWKNTILFNLASVFFLILSFPYIFSLVFHTVVASKKRDWAFLIIISPAWYLFFLNAAITHNIPRYNQPLIPLFAVLFLLMIHQLIESHHKKWMTNQQRIKLHD